MCVFFRHRRIYGGGKDSIFDKIWWIYVLPKNIGSLYSSFVFPNSYLYLPQVSSSFHLAAEVADTGIVRFCAITVR